MTGSGVVRTLKAEKRLQIYNFSENNNSESSVMDDQQISSLDPREVEAEKRAAWRKARFVEAITLYLQCFCLLKCGLLMYQKPMQRNGLGSL